MILREFTTNDAAKFSKLTQALTENYDYDIDFSNMTVARANRMINKTNQRIAEVSDTNRRVKLGMIAESLSIWKEAAIQTELTSMVAEGLGDEEMEGAKVILAAKELSDKIQSMIEDAAKMQVQDLLPIVDAMKAEIGTAEAEAFSQAADAAIGGLVEATKSAKEGYDNAIATAQGQDVGMDMDNFDGEAGMDDVGMDDMDVDMSAMGDEMPDDLDGEMDMGDDLEDEFGGDDATVGGETPSGRELKAEF